jgi:hypothetical protein
LSGCLTQVKISTHRRDGRVVEGGGLENRFPVSGTGVRIPLPPPFTFNKELPKAKINEMRLKFLAFLGKYFLRVKIWENLNGSLMKG